MTSATGALELDYAFDSHGERGYSAPFALDHATPPYAYVVDHRPLDGCATPNCPIKGRAASGFADQIQPDGDPGAYVTAGHGVDTELYYRRGVVLRPRETFAFTLPPSAAETELDAYLSTASGGRSYDARVTFSVVHPVAGPTLVGEHRFEGRTERFMPPMPATQGKTERYLRHLRVPIPARTARLIRVTIENVGSEKLSVGTPLVMRKVEGRGPRQAVFALFDAVPSHLLDAILRGDTGEERTRWLRKEVATSGLYFPEAVSPGQGTTGFFARFFTGKLWGGRGWPGMFGASAIDESLPDELDGPFARLSGQGFVTELIGNNFLLGPHLSVPGLDAGYQIESDTHAEAMERYLLAWVEDHPRDDAALVLWNAQTHSPYPPGRPSPPTPTPKELAPAEVNETPNTAVWRNLTDGVDHLQVELSALRRAAPDAERVVWISADHGRGITQKMEHRAFRTIGGLGGSGLSHGSANTVEEMRTPYALLFDGPSRPSFVPRVVPGITSTLGVWRVIEERFGLDLGLTPSTSFDHPLFTGARAPNPWVDNVFLAVGMTGSLRVVSGSLAYGLFSPALTAAPIWSLPAPQQRVMLGAPTRNGFVVAEELYDDAADPYELTNLASERFSDVLRLRRELVDVVAAHYDPPNHPRNVYTLELPERRELRIASLGKLRVLVDGNPVPSVDPRVVVVTASQLDIVETEDPLGLVEIAALDGKAPVLLRCAANGLMLDELSDERPRLDLALARTNCPLPATGREIARAGEMLFTFRKAQRADMGSAVSLPGSAGGGGGAVGDDLLAGMKRWGYVRDIDENKP